MMKGMVRISVLSPRSLDRVVPTCVALTTIPFLASASSSGMVVVKETETTSPLYKPVSRGVKEMAVFFHQEVLALYRMHSPVIAKPSSCRGPILTDGLTPDMCKRGRRRRYHARKRKPDLYPSRGFWALYGGHSKVAL
uniref:Uncharacterized protein n=1 Tax=Magallana gigas TaxID=29159 RepID=K1Q076_MAGGI